ncbi:unnamed protein product [Symbiodinium natans]|uniref:Protein kinase domain-containing protein n=1 Tax=Symbiodinium natans TaxID=878477 RepID=A0A812J1L8_9DINO|nr:unnamed protein product [Symbiodinium natans]
MSHTVGAFIAAPRTTNTLAELRLKTVCVSGVQQSLDSVAQLLSLQEVVLADFGAAAKCGRAMPVVAPACIEDIAPMFELCGSCVKVGTPLYLPPEAFRRRDYRIPSGTVFYGEGFESLARGLQGPAGDVWSCGVGA